MSHVPHVTIVCATSLDGKLSNVARDPVRFTSRRDRARLHALRDGADAVLVGAATIRAEDPPLLPDAARQAARVAAGRRALPVRAVLSRTLEIPVGRALAPREGSPVHVFTTEAAPGDRRLRLEESGVRVHASGPVIDPRTVLETLARDSVGRLVLEGGGEANATFLAAGLVDALELTLCPVVIGGAAAPTLVDGPGLATLVRATLVAHEVTPEGEVFLRYALPR